jgi:radical SAM superfamily enzyme YgiQ (UPF0313 family)
VAAFYILGLENDTADSIEQTIEYAIKLNTPVARFSVATPYPGTDFFRQLERESRLLTTEYERYSQFNLVFKHANLTPEDIRRLLGRAYRRYYLRPSYAWMLCKSKIRKPKFSTMEYVPSP